MIESEKLLERKLRTSVENLGGLSLKMVTTHFSGLPDRLCLLPGGRLFFCEIKTTKKTPRKIQVKVHNMIKKLGFQVYIIDTSEQIKQIIKEYEQG